MTVASSSSSLSKPSTSPTNFLNIYLFGLSCGTRDVQSSLRHAGSLVEAFQIFFFFFKAVSCGIYFPDQGSNLGPLHWECGVFTTGPAAKSQPYQFCCLEILCLPLTPVQPILLDWTIAGTSEPAPAPALILEHPSSSPTARDTALRPHNWPHI